MAEKMRVHILARELGVPSKTIIAKCRAEGIGTVKNHMSALTAGLHATIREWFSEGSPDTAVETTAPVDLEKVRVKRRLQAGGNGAPATAVEPQEVAPTPTAEATTETPADSSTAVAVEMASTDIEGPTELEAHAAPLKQEAATLQVEPVSAIEAPVAPGEPLIDRPPDTTEVTESGTTVVEVTTEAPSPPTTPERVKPAGPQNVPVPAKLRGPRVVRYEPTTDLQPVRRGPSLRQRTAPEITPQTTDTTKPDARPKPVDRAAARRQARSGARQTVGRVGEAGERLAEWRDRDLAERKERLAGATGRRIHHRRATHATSSARPRTEAGPKTHATINAPVRMKDFCATTGLNFLQLFRVLREEHNLVANVNMTLLTETAQLLAMHFGIELTVIPMKTKLDELQEEFAKRKRDHLEPRPPVVAMLGHVDHGKTSLLDAIRRTRVASGEDGGITQHIGSYHLETSRGAVTFLDTPGHEAFSEMRARGANLTDVVVLVVAADDGVMPQTVEAINHAKSAEVPIVVALNKIDLGDQNELKIFGQLAERGLTPSGEWGGEVDVIPTSATTGTGVQQLIEHLADLSSILDLKADPRMPASGTVIEAETKPGVGPVARVLIQDGTLQIGDFIVCGNASGKVRALLDDRGQRIRKAGPSVPAEVWGLDDVPAAGDKLYQVETMQRAKEVATETRQRRIESGRAQSSKGATLEEMFLLRDAGEIPELNLIIKGDVDGSVEALRQALSKIKSDEVRLVVRHAGVGPVNDGDVLLAATCRGIAVAFRVDVPTGVRRLADRHGVDVRSYRVIYEMCDDIKKALEGLLAPEERVEIRGGADVRQVFNITKVGTVAGSLVSHGTLDRSHLVKVIRDGVVVREGCRLASLRRFKDDVKEVRSGMECGVRLEDFNDIHVGDRIETYEIVKVARTL